MVGLLEGAPLYFLSFAAMNLKKIIATVALTSVLGGLTSGSEVLAADSPHKGKVVINEIAWMGSVDSSTDEWLELYNDSDTAIDLTGWKITDDATSDYLITAGTIPSKGYFLIEDNENAVKNIAADIVINLSLANTGDSLVLKDGNGDIVDTVNGTGGAWYGGNSTTGATMERKLVVGADSKDNWMTAISGSGSQASGGSNILGTPKIANSSSLTGVSLNFEAAPLSVAAGGIVNIKMNSGQVSDLFSYGFDITYDPTILELLSASKGTFLNYSGNEETAFQSGLLSGVAGDLVVGEARTFRPKSGITGEGELFNMSFKVIGSEGDIVEIKVDQTKSFLTNFSGTELPYNIAPLKIVVAGGGTSVQPVTDLIAGENTNRYELKLSWTAPLGGADAYKIFRKGVDGTLLNIASVTTTDFVDKDGINMAGNIIAGRQYEYQVIALKGTDLSIPASVTATETRGIKADINRDDRVDGRDLNALAIVYGLDITFADYNHRADLNYDGDINGSDLIDMAADWAKVYLP